VFGRSLWSRIALTYAALTIVCVGAISLYMLFIGRDSYLAVLNRDVEVEARMLSAAARPLTLRPLTARQNRPACQTAGARGRRPHHHP